MKSQPRLFTTLKHLFRSYLFFEIDLYILVGEQPGKDTVMPSSLYEVDPRVIGLIAGLALSIGLLIGEFIGKRRALRYLNSDEFQLRIVEKLIGTLNSRS